MKRRILIIEDDPHIALGLEELLKVEGFEVQRTGRGDDAVELVVRIQPDLVVLDVMLPGLSGYEVCRQIRERRLQTAVLMLTAKGQELDKVVGLDLGADDYVTKPFGVRELLARIQAVLRRSGQRENPASGDGPFRIGDAEVDPRRLQLVRAGAEQELTARELKLLQLFYTHAGEVLSRDRLLNEAWGHGYFGTTRTLDQVIVQLRRKLGDRAEEPRHLLTVHGVGYRLKL